MAGYPAPGHTCGGREGLRRHGGMGGEGFGGGTGGDGNKMVVTESEDRCEVSL